MLARNELLENLLDTYGHCDRPMEPRNLCYWGPGCLKTGWLGRACPHWHPIEGEALDALMSHHIGAGQPPASR